MISKATTQINAREAIELKDQRASELLKSGKSRFNTPKGVEKASSQFESLLLNQMFKEMWQTVETTGFLGENSNEANIYRDMLNQAISDEVSQGKGMGVKKFLKKELNKYIEES